MKHFLMESLWPSYGREVHRLNNELYCIHPHTWLGTQLPLFRP
jgi:hypothetical protein